jgi:hypothetical protein
MPGAQEKKMTLPRLHGTPFPNPLENRAFEISSVSPDHKLRRQAHGRRRLRSPQLAPTCSMISAIGRWFATKPRLGSHPSCRRKSRLSTSTSKKLSVTKSEKPYGIGQVNHRAQLADATRVQKAISEKAKEKMTERGVDRFLTSGNWASSYGVNAPEAFTPPESADRQRSTGVGYPPRGGTEVQEKSRRRLLLRAIPLSFESPE